jgi:ATP-dependent helicase/nuclease subunit A
MTADARARCWAVEEVGRSFVLEASAGTGKTSILIERIVRLVLVEGPAGPPLRLREIAAITFTEKAAGEMKVRLRQEFEKRAAGPGPEAELAAQALRDLETASISTIHAFAVSLLKERPVEAGIDPRFRALDEAEVELLFSEVWEAWLERAVADRGAAIERALRGGMALGDLRHLARTVSRHARELRELSPVAAAGGEEIEAERAALLRRGAALVPLILDPGDLLVGPLRAALEWLSGGPRNPPPAGNSGRAAAWKGGRTTLDSARDFVRQTVELARKVERLAAERLLLDTARWLQSEFLPEWEGRKRRDGLLEFDDQLLAARALLAGSPASRRDFQAQFSTLLIDEFQDTDPVQLEIALLLSCTDLGAVKLDDLRPAPGRLFIVGDPKQSIYRFRGADIETYLAAARHERGLDPLKLTTNFRSLPPILLFADALFGRILPAEGASYQPAYLGFGGAGARSGGHDGGVHLLCNGLDETDRPQNTRRFCEREAARIAELVHVMTSSPQWNVEERDGSRRRGARPRDIAVLLPVLSYANILEEALREADVPYVLEGGKFYYERSEVSSAITVLGAVANPGDRVALYGALRSIFFGLSDEDLLRARIDGVPLDYRQDPPAGSKLEAPFALLRKLSDDRNLRPASETLELLLAGTGAREVLASRPGGVQSISNLAKLARTLRARQSSRTFSEVMELVTAMDELGREESESRVMEERSDAVRISSIHRAKGLDFPIVIVAGLGLKRSTRSADFLADRHERRCYALRLERTVLQSPGWKDLEKWESEREAAEQVRLLYVALTRARDHLVVSTHVRWRGEEAIVEGTRLEKAFPVLLELAAADPPLARVIDTAPLDASAAARKPVPAAAHAHEWDWSAELIAGYAELERLRSIPASVLPAKAPAEDDDEARLPDVAQSRARRLGIAFHEAMELADWRQPDSFEERAREVGARHRLDRDAVRWIGRAMQLVLESDLIRRALAAEAAGRPVWRELPYLRPAPQGRAGAMQEGRIDLVFRDARGWVVVDYKTDEIPRGEADPDSYFRERYAPQLREYADALRQLGIAPVSSFLLLARTGRAVEVPLAGALDSRRSQRTIQGLLPFSSEGGPT